MAKGTGKQTSVLTVDLFKRDEVEHVQTKLNERYAKLERPEHSFSFERDSLQRQRTSLIEMS